MRCTPSSPGRIGSVNASCAGWPCSSWSVRPARRLNFCELRARLAAAAGIAHAPGIVAYDQHDLVAEVLELAQLAQPDGVAEMDVGRGGVEPLLDAQRTFPGAGLLEPPQQVAVRQDLVGAAGQDLGLLFGSHGSGWTGTF